MRVGINGFGRIGRTFFRTAFQSKDVEISHINDVGDAQMLAQLLQFDSTYGIWDHDVRAAGGHLVVDGKRIPLSQEKQPGNLPWRDHGIDLVLESSGKFRKGEEAQAHIGAGAKKVLISAPGKTPLDGDFVLGVNEERYDPDSHQIISIGSCTTNCLAPLVKVLNDEFTIQHGLMTTAHAYTADQNLLDGPHKDPRRARSAAENIVPTSTGAAEAISKVIPEMEGKLNGLALRVPVACGSIVDLTCVVEKSTSVDEVNEAMRRHSGDAMKGILQVEDRPVVSRDIVGNPHSAIFSSRDTFVQNGTLVKVLAWYDNEWGFSNRLKDMIQHMARVPVAG